MIDAKNEKIKQEITLSLLNYVKPIIKTFDTELLRKFGFGTHYQIDNKIFDNEFSILFPVVYQFHSKWIGKLILRGSHKISPKLPNLWTPIGISLTFEKTTDNGWSLVSKNGYVLDEEDDFHIDVHNYLKSKFLTVEK